jgi:(p)ppGpp synthase/HD superfamily hydrolase
MRNLEDAEAFATTAHAGQWRKHAKDARPYIYHPQRVVLHLAGKPYATEELIAAAWLHDVVEDCGVSIEELSRKFGPLVAGFVFEVSHPATPPGLPRRERWPIYLQHYAGASLDGKRLKLADRACNLAEYADFWSDVDTKERTFIRGVYQAETNDLVEIIGHADPGTTRQIRSTMEWLIQNA